MPSPSKTQAEIRIERQVPLDWYRGNPWEALRFVLRNTTEVLVDHLQANGGEWRMPLAGSLEVFTSELEAPHGNDITLHVLIRLPPQEGPSNAIAV